jgi:isoleucyl-tRNA synthetase
VTLAQLLAPFAPFLAEELYQNLVRSVAPDAPQSVHLTDFPVADGSKINQRLSADIRLAMKIASLGRATRSKAGIKVRQPLPVNYLSSASASHRQQLDSALERIKPQILEELNIKDVMVVADFNGLGEESLVTNTEGDLSCALSTAIPAELKAEGMAREIVHRLQNMRRSAGFDIADHIRAYYQGGPYIKQVVADFADYIRQETLSTELIEGISQEGVFTESYKLDGHEISLGVSRLV